MFVLFAGTTIQSPAWNTVAFATPGVPRSSMAS
jgi:hypothetical protein